MFQRRDKINILDKFRTWVWPRSGWRRMILYLSLRLARMPGTSYSIAAGFACGAAVSFTPFVGAHFLLAGILAWIIRANIFVAFLGTIVGNPWTFPVIWIWLYNTGNWVLIRNSDTTPSKLPDFYSNFTKLLDSLLLFDQTLILDAAIPVIWPMLVGSIPTSIIIWFMFFIPVKKAIESYQHRRIRKQFHLHQRHQEHVEKLSNNDLPGGFE